MNLEARIVSLLRMKRIFFASTESCTGGLIADRITDIPGASDVFWGGLVTYDATAKISLAGVSPATLLQHTAVSEKVAREMAESTLKKMSSARKMLSLSVSTTGIADPAGGAPCVCFIAVAATGRETRVERFVPSTPASSQTRRKNKEEFANRALQLALETLLT